MLLRKILNEREIEICVDLYIKDNDETFIPASRKDSLEAMTNHLKSNAFFRILEDDGKIVAWILAKRHKPDHISQMVFQQMYYGSALKGIKSARAVKILHEALIEEAKRMNIKRIISSGNHLDTENVFTRILEKAGWKRRGYIATFELI